MIFWCIITDDEHLLELFWSESRDPMMTALVIASIYRSLSKGVYPHELMSKNRLLIFSRFFFIFRVAHFVLFRFWSNNSR